MRTNTNPNWNVEQCKIYNNKTNKIKMIWITEKGCKSDNRKAENQRN